MRFTKPTKVIGLDVGSHSVKAVQMSKAGGKLRIDDVGYALVDRNQVNIDPVAAHANALREAIRTMPIPQCAVVGALPGQTVVIRYPRLRDMDISKIDDAVEAEAGQNIPYDLSEVFLDWSLLEEEGEGDARQLKVLLVAAKHEVIDSRVQIADAAEVQYSVLSVDSLSLADAAEGCDFLRVGETVALINIGASSASIHFTKDGISNFIRDVSWGAREMIQAIAKAQRCDYETAERTLYGADDEIQKKMADAALGAPAVPDDEPTTSHDIGGPAAGGGAGSLLDPLDDELGGLDDIGLTGNEPSGIGGELGGGYDDTDNAEPEEADLTEVLTMPISRLVSEIRRSFDYYEHQLYERPVDRIIISGGVAHFSLIRNALIEDLGVEDVQVADPFRGAVALSRGVDSNPAMQHPAQFMVAVGLAARGAADI